MQLMKDRPTSWGENLIECCKDITETDEQMMFLQWLADPTGGTKRHLNIKECDVVDTPCFEDDKRFNTEEVSGKVRTVHVTMRKQDQDDEKEQDDEKKED